MKVSGKADTPGAEVVREIVNRNLRQEPAAEGSNDAVKIGTNRTPPGATVTPIASGRDHGQDRVEVSLSRSIAAELSPEAMLLERRAKVEQLKQAITGGVYKPASDEIAPKFLEEVSLQILEAVAAGNE